MDLETVLPLPRLRWRRQSGSDAGERMTPEETPVAIVHDGSTTAVMMATPADLEDFGVGFSLSEGVIARRSEIRDIEIVSSDLGVEIRLWLTADRSYQQAQRRRTLAGPTGCGLCGVDSLVEALRPVARLEGQDITVKAAALLDAMEALEEAQRLGALSRAVHAAGLWREGTNLIIREDVGRHNALDKLIGAAAATGGGSGGVVLLTSRVSVEMVQKAAALGAPILCAISAPTALAVRTAEAAGITLVGVARRDGFEVFTHASRILLEP